MGIYTSETAVNAIKYIEDAMSSTDCNVTYEIQDGGDFLLLIIDLKEELPLRTLEKFHQDFKNIFSRKFPKVSRDYSWMIVFRYQETVIDSVFDDIK